MTRPRNPGAASRPKPDDAATDPGPPPDFGGDPGATQEHPSSGRVATARTESLPLIPFRSFAAEVRVREMEGEPAPGPVDLRQLVLPTADELAARQHAEARPLPKPVDNYHTIPDAKVLLNVTQPPPPSSGRAAPASTVPIRRPTERMADVPMEQLLFRERERNQRYAPTGARLLPHGMTAKSPEDATSPLRLLSLRGLIATFVVGAAVVVVLSVFVLRRGTAPAPAVGSAGSPAPATPSSAPPAPMAPPPESASAAASVTAPARPVRPAPRPAKPVQPAPKRAAPPIDF